MYHFLYLAREGDRLKSELLKLRQVLWNLRKYRIQHLKRGKGLNFFFIFRKSVHYSNWANMLNCTAGLQGSWRQRFHSQLYPFTRDNLLHRCKVKSRLIKFTSPVTVDNSFRIRIEGETLILYLSVSCTWFRWKFSKVVHVHVHYNYAKNNEEIYNLHFHHYLRKITTFQ